MSCMTTSLQTKEPYFENEANGRDSGFCEVYRNVTFWAHSRA